MMKRIKILNWQRGLVFRGEEFKCMLGPGIHWVLDPLFRTRVDILSTREPEIMHDELEAVVRSGQLKGEATVVRLGDTERALVWYDGRFEGIFSDALNAFWNMYREVKVEIVEATKARFQHKDFNVIVRSASALGQLERFTVEEGHVAVTFVDGDQKEILPAGQYAFWKGVRNVRFLKVDMREDLLDVSGQDIITADKVTLRLNMVVAFRVQDASKVILVTRDYKQALYREAQLALRAVVGTRELDQILMDKDGVSAELDAALKAKAPDYGLQILSVGIKDFILPGDMKALMNQVTQAKKAAEAALIARREETAAMRSQANTARLLENNPTLMRLKELEVIEKIATSSELKMFLGEKGLADRVVNLL